MLSGIDVVTEWIFSDSVNSARFKFGIFCLKLKVHRIVEYNKHYGTNAQNTLKSYITA